MDFKNYLRPYMQQVGLKEFSGSDYVDGVWVDGVEKTTLFTAAITTFTDDSLQFGEAGTYTQNDRKLFTYKKLHRGDKVIANGDTYTITEERDYAFYAKGLRMYVGERDGSVS